MADDILRDPSDIDGAVGPGPTGATGPAGTAGAAGKDSPALFEKMTGTVRETCPRVFAGPLTALGSGIWNSGQIIASLITLYAGDTCTTARFWNTSGAASTALTHSWGVLFDSTGLILAISPDDTTQWLGSASHSFTFTSPYSVTSTGVYYLGVCAVQASGTFPTIAGYLFGASVTAALHQASPSIVAKAGSNLTTPPSVGSNVGAFTNNTALNRIYGEIL